MSNNITEGTWGTIYVSRYADASKSNAVISWKSKIKMWYSKYSI